MKWRRVAAIAGGVVAAFVAWRTYTWLRPPPKLVVSRETTWFTEPLDADGNVDYAEIWRRRHAPGVTAANNAAPLVYAALGWDTSPFTAEERAGLPKVESPFVSFEDWSDLHHDAFAPAVISEQDAAFAAQGELDAGEVGGSQERAITIWLEQVTPSLDVLNEASLRPRFHALDSSPLAEDPSRLWLLRDVAKALAWRAMRSSSRRESERAAADFGAALRLARQLRSNEGHVASLIASVCEEVVWSAVPKAAEKVGGLPAPCIREIADSGDPVSVEAKIVESLDWGRITILHGIARPKASETESWVAPVLAHLDPNDVARRLNAAFDEVDAAWRKDGDWSDRIDRTVRLNERLTKRQRSQRSPPWLWDVVLGPATFAEDMCDYVAAQCTAQHHWHLLVFVDGVARADCTLVELAAATFAHDAGRDPATSDDLTPSLFASPFRDRLTGSRVAFARDESGRLVASGPIVELKQRLDAATR
jgi:hypothetical protein